MEIGPGTGQATRPLAERGLSVTALEVDERLAARAAENLADLPDVLVVTTSFEDWVPDAARFAMVFACNAFHWVDHELGLAKAAAVLDDGGSFAVVTTPVVVPDGASRFWWDVQDDWVSVGSQRLDPATQHPDRVSDFAAPIQACGLFEDPLTRRYRFDVVMTAADYVANLSSQSGVKQLDRPAQAALLDRIGTRVEAHGGTVTVHHLAVLTVARKR